MLRPKTNKLALLIVPVLALTSFGAFAEDKQDVREETMTSIRYSKQELKDAANPNFIKTRDLSNVLAEKLTLLAATLTQRQGGSNSKLYEMAANNTQMTHEQYMKKLGTLVYDPNQSSKVDGDAVRTHLSGQSRKTVEVKFKEAVPFVEEIRKGFNFKYSLNGKKTSTSSNSSPSSPDIRYGLVVADIQPANENMGVASLGSTNDMGLEYATPARVVYTIDKIDDQPVNRKVFPEAAPSNTDSFTPAKEATDVWRHPSTDVDIKVEAANSDDTVSDKVTGGALPGGKVTFSQADGLVAAQLVTNSKLGREGLNYETKLPIYGEASIARKMDEHFRPTQTSAYNLLVAKNAPKLNLHYINTEERFKGELLIKGARYDMGVVAEPRTGWGPGQKMGQAGDKVSLTYNQNF